ncbi:MAG TPA: macro domain-containing protein, partial [Terriglobales bacterium]|nr:macro domain-containing protein [Terriglobales bacterium]
RAEAETLDSCYRESLRIADQHGLKSVAFPSISTGAYGYPVDEAAKVAVSAVIEALRGAKHVVSVRFVLFDGGTLQSYLSAAGKFDKGHR